jgi:hypothetical protein
VFHGEIPVHGLLLDIIETAGNDGPKALYVFRDVPTRATLLVGLGAGDACWNVEFGRVSIDRAGLYRYAQLVT